MVTVRSVLGFPIIDIVRQFVHQLVSNVLEFAVVDFLLDVAILAHVGLQSLVLFIVDSDR